ncbi:MAG TPA: flagellar basal body rod protein FlgC [Terriglobales bacterium]|nr:flagellar basal body rod protein FlgC [Terriglobales bacterium]
MNLFGVLDISASALLAERQRAEVVTSNLANAESAGANPAKVYRRQEVVFGSQAMPFAETLAAAGGASQGASANVGEGVAVEGVVTDSSPLVRRYEPGNVNADAAGYVSYPNVNPVQEMTDLMEAVRSYQLNISAAQATKSMIQQSLTLLS